MGRRILAAVVLPLTLAVTGWGQDVPPQAVVIMRQSQIPFLIREDVARGLGLTSGQQAAIKGVLDDSGKKKGQSIPNLGSFGAGFIREMIRAEIHGIEQKCIAVLDVKQQARLKELRIQWLGGTALFDRSIRKELATTRDQDRAIAALQKSAEQTRKDANDEGDPSPTPSEKRDTVAVLTDDQAKKLVALGGTPFTFDSPVKNFVEFPANMSTR